MTDTPRNSKSGKSSSKAEKDNNTPGTSRANPAKKDDTSSKSKKKKTKKPEKVKADSPGVSDSSSASASSASSSSKKTESKRKAAREPAQEEEKKAVRQPVQPTIKSTGHRVNLLSPEKEEQQSKTLYQKAVEDAKEGRTNIKMPETSEQYYELEEILMNPARMEGSQLSLNAYDNVRSRYDVLPSKLTSEANMKEVIGSLSCDVCQEVIQMSVVTKKCGHRFCDQCILITLMRAGNQCPACRQNLGSKRELQQDPRFDELIHQMVESRAIVPRLMAEKREHEKDVYFGRKGYIEGESDWNKRYGIIPDTGEKRMHATLAPKKNRIGWFADGDNRGAINEEDSDEDSEENVSAPTTSKGKPSKADSPIITLKDAAKDDKTEEPMVVDGDKKKTRKRAEKKSKSPEAIVPDKPKEKSPEISVAKGRKKRTAEPIASDDVEKPAAAAKDDDVIEEGEAAFPIEFRSDDDQSGLDGESDDSDSSLSDSSDAVSDGFSDEEFLDKGILIRTGPPSKTMSDSSEVESEKESEAEPEPEKPVEERKKKKTRKVRTKHSEIDCGLEDSAESSSEEEDSDEEEEKVAPKKPDEKKVREEGDITTPSEDSLTSSDEDDDIPNADPFDFVFQKEFNRDPRRENAERDVLFNFDFAVDHDIKVDRAFEQDTEVRELSDDSNSSESDSSSEDSSSEDKVDGVKVSDQVKSYLRKRAERPADDSSDEGKAKRARLENERSTKVTTVSTTAKSTKRAEGKTLSETSSDSSDWEFDDEVKLVGDVKTVFKMTGSSTKDNRMFEGFVFRPEDKKADRPTVQRSANFNFLQHNDAPDEVYHFYPGQNQAKHGGRAEQDGKLKIPPKDYQVPLSSSDSDDTDCGKSSESSSSPSLSAQSSKSTSRRVSPVVARPSAGPSRPEPASSHSSNPEQVTRRITRSLGRRLSSSSSSSSSATSSSSSSSSSGWSSPDPPEPSTSAPSASRPSTSKPSTSGDPSCKPSTSEQSSSGSSTSKPSTKKRSTTTLSTSKTSTAKPSTSKPSSCEPSTSEPSTSASTSKPSTSAQAADNDNRSIETLSSSSSSLSTSSDSENESYTYKELVERRKRLGIGKVINAPSDLRDISFDKPTFDISELASSVKPVLKHKVFWDSSFRENTTAKYVKDAAENLTIDEANQMEAEQVIMEEDRIHRQLGAVLQAVEAAAKEFNVPIESSEDEEEDLGDDDEEEDEMLEDEEMEEGDDSLVVDEAEADQTDEGAADPDPQAAAVSPKPAVVPLAQPFAMSAMGETPIADMFFDENEPCSSAQAEAREKIMERVQKEQELIAESFKMFKKPDVPPLLSANLHGPLPSSSFPFSSAALPTGVEKPKKDEVNDGGKAECKKEDVTMIDEEEEESDEEENGKKVPKREIVFKEEVDENLKEVRFLVKKEVEEENSTSEEEDEEEEEEEGEDVESEEAYSDFEERLEVLMEHADKEAIRPTLADYAKSEFYKMAGKYSQANDDDLIWDFCARDTEAEFEVLDRTGKKSARSVEDIRLEQLVTKFRKDFAARRPTTALKKPPPGIERQLIDRAHLIRYKHTVDVDPLHMKILIALQKQQIAATCANLSQPVSVTPEEHAEQVQLLQNLQNPSVLRPLLQYPQFAVTLHKAQQQAIRQQVVLQKALQQKQMAARQAEQARVEELARKRIAEEDAAKKAAEQLATDQQVLQQPVAVVPASTVKGGPDTVRTDTSESNKIQSPLPVETSGEKPASTSAQKDNETTPKEGQASTNSSDTSASDTNLAGKVTNDVDNTIPEEGEKVGDMEDDATHFIDETINIDESLPTSEFEAHLKKKDDDLNRELLSYVSRYYSNAMNALSDQRVIDHKQQIQNLLASEDLQKVLEGQEDGDVMEMEDAVEGNQEEEGDEDEEDEEVEAAEDGEEVFVVNELELAKQIMMHFNGYDIFEEMESDDGDVEGRAENKSAEGSDQTLPYQKRELRANPKIFIPKIPHRIRKKFFEKKMELERLRLRNRLKNQKVSAMRINVPQRQPPKFATPHLPVRGPGKHSTPRGAPKPKKQKMSNVQMSIVQPPLPLHQLQGQMGAPTKITAVPNVAAGYHPNQEQKIHPGMAQAPQSTPVRATTQPGPSQTTQQPPQQQSHLAQLGQFVHGTAQGRPQQMTPAQYAQLAQNPQAAAQLAQVAQMAQAAQNPQAAAQLVQAAQMAQASQNPQASAQLAQAAQMGQATQNPQAAAQLAQIAQLAQAAQNPQAAAQLAQLAQLVQAAQNPQAAAQLAQLAQLTQAAQNPQAAAQLAQITQMAQAAQNPQVAAQLAQVAQMAQAAQNPQAAAQLAQAAQMAQAAQLAQLAQQGQPAPKMTEQQLHAAIQAGALSLPTLDPQTQQVILSRVQQPVSDQQQKLDEVQSIQRILNARGQFPPTDENKFIADTARAQADYNNALIAMKAQQEALLHQQALMRQAQEQARIQQQAKETARLKAEAEAAAKAKAKAEADARKKAEKELRARQAQEAREKAQAQAQAQAQAKAQAQAQQAQAQAQAQALLQMHAHAQAQAHAHAQAMTYMEMQKAMQSGQPVPTPQQLQQIHQMQHAQHMQQLQMHQAFVARMQQGTPNPAATPQAQVLAAPKPGEPSTSSRPIATPAYGMMPGPTPSVAATPAPAQQTPALCTPAPPTPSVQQQQQIMMQMQMQQQQQQQMLQQQLQQQLLQQQQHQQMQMQQQLAQAGIPNNWIQQQFMQLLGQPNAPAQLAQTPAPAPAAQQVQGVAPRQFAQPTPAPLPTQPTTSANQQAAPTARVDAVEVELELWPTNGYADKKRQEGAQTIPFFCASSGVTHFYHVLGLVRTRSTYNASDVGSVWVLKLDGLEIRKFDLQSTLAEAQQFVGKQHVIIFYDDVNAGEVEQTKEYIINKGFNPNNRPNN